MKIDLHIHSKEGSDGRWAVEHIFAEAARRGIDVISITDHDSIAAQAAAANLAAMYGIGYISGVELNVTLPLPHVAGCTSVSLDFLGYGFDPEYGPLVTTLEESRRFRQERARRILENLNLEFRKQGIPEFTEADLEAIEATVDGAFGRPHIANYMVRKGICRDRQEAFDTYLVACNVPKLPLSLEEASRLVRGASGVLILAHPSDPNGTSLAAVSRDLETQHNVIIDLMMEQIDGVECWHSRHTPEATDAHLIFARKHALMVSGGSDCHQEPPIMGDVDIPEYVAEQFFARQGAHQRQE